MKTLHYLLLTLFLNGLILNDLASQQIDFCGVFPPNTAQSSNWQEVVYDRFGNSFDLISQNVGQAFPSASNCYDPINDVPNLTYSNSVYQLRYFLDNPQYNTPAFRAVIEEVFDNLQTTIGLPSTNCSDDGTSPLVIIDIVDCPVTNNAVAATGSAFYLPVFGNCDSGQPHVTSVVESILHAGLNPYGGPSGVICFNDNFGNICPFDLNADPSNVTGFDLRTVVLHEMMHVFGFASTPNLIDGVALTSWDLNVSFLDSNNPPSAPVHSTDCMMNDGCYMTDLGLYQQGIDSSPCQGATTGLTIGSQQVSIQGQGNFANGGLTNPQNANSASHICSVPGENTVMTGGAACGDVRRIITNSELSILSDLGYDVGNGFTPACVQVTNGEYSTPNEQDCCDTEGISSCINQLIEIDISDIICNDFTSSSTGLTLSSFVQVDTGDGLVSDNVQINGNTISLTVTEFPGTMSNIVTYKYVLEGCPCRFSTGIVEVLIAICSDCDPVDECDNLSCLDLQDQPLGAVSGGINGINFTTPVTPLGNSPDVLLNNVDGLNYLGVSVAIEEGFAIPLQKPLLPGCDLLINFDYNSYESTFNPAEINTARFSISEEAPCDINDTPISNDGETPITCENSVYDPILIETFISNPTVTQWTFGSPNNFFSGQTIGHSIQYTNDTQEPLNFITIVSDRGNGQIGWLLFTDITIVDDCTFMPIVEVQPQSCNEFIFEVINEPDQAIDFEYVWDFGDGNTTTTTTNIVNHTYAEDDTYDVVVTVIDECGNEESTELEVNVACASNSECFEENGEIVLDATQGENRLSQLTNNFNPLNQTIIVIGDLHVDVDWNLTVCDIIMESNASILIRGNSFGFNSITMDMLGGSITRCDQRWNTIEVVGTNFFFPTIPGTLKLQQVDPIEGGVDAVSLNSGSNIEVTGCNFVDNIIGISFGRVTNSLFNLGFNNLGMSQNTFSGIGESVAGIWLENMFFFEMPVGGTGSGSTALETFRDMQNGIVLKNVFNANISNVLVENIDASLVFGQNHSCDDISDPDCSGFGIFMDRGGLTLSESNFINYSGVGLRSIGAFNPVNVTQCNFRNLQQCPTFSCDSNNAGIWMTNSRNTFIEDDNKFFNCRTGIRGETNFNMLIEDAEFENSAIGGFSGNISLSNTTQLSILNNNIFDERLATNVATPAINVFNNNFDQIATIDNNNLRLADNGVQNGMSINGVAGGSISSNTISASLPTVGGIGISVRESFRNGYCCNMISGPSRGLRMRDNVSASELQSNTFDNNSIGLLLTGVTQDGIGIQPNHGNLWFGPDTEAELEIVLRMQ